MRRSKPLQWHDAPQDWAALHIVRRPRLIGLWVLYDEAKKSIGTLVLLFGPPTGSTKYTIERLTRDMKSAGWSKRFDSNGEAIGWVSESLSALQISTVELSNCAGLAWENAMECLAAITRGMVRRAQ